MLALLLVAAQIGTLATVSGKVVDLTRHPTGSLLFCTDQGNVGLVATTGGVTILATAASAPFPAALRGVVGHPGGDVSVIDLQGDIYKLAGGAPPAVKVYADAFMIQSPTDLLRDASGNYVVTSLTPTTGVRAPRVAFQPTSGTSGSWTWMRKPTAAWSCSSATSCWTGTAHSSCRFPACSSVLGSCYSSSPARTSRICFSFVPRSDAAKWRFGRRWAREGQD